MKKYLNQIIVYSLHFFNILIYFFRKFTILFEILYKKAYSFIFNDSKLDYYFAKFIYFWWVFFPRFFLIFSLLFISLFVISFLFDFNFFSSLFFYIIFKFCVTMHIFYGLRIVYLEYILANLRWKSSSVFNGQKLHVFILFLFVFFIFF